MGMYTELVLNVEVRKDAGQDVLDCLYNMVNNGEQAKPPAKDEENALFKTDRWRFMLKTGSFYFTPFSTSAYRELQGNFYLSIRTDLKNYSGEIEKFLEWLVQYVDGYEGDFMGYKRYEERDDPTLLYIGAAFTVREKSVALPDV